MDGIHDLGGKQGFGDIKLETDPRPFPERWHGAVFTMINTLAAAGVTQFTAMSQVASSLPMALVKPMTPALEAA